MNNKTQSNAETNSADNSAVAGTAMPNEFWDSLFGSDFSKQITPEDVTHWAEVMVRMQQMLVDYGQKQVATVQPDMSALFDPTHWQSMPSMQSAQAAWAQGSQLWLQAADQWLALLQGNQDAPQGDSTGDSTGDSRTDAPTASPQASASETKPAPRPDRRFDSPEWNDNPVFSILRQSYLAIAEQMLASAESLDASDLDPAVRDRLRFATQNLVDASAPSNFLWSNPQVIQRAIETRGESLVNGLRHMLDDMERGQVTHVDRSSFTVGENIAATPGKVIYETPLYQLIHYTPTTDSVLETPLVIFPPWINRFYILDLSPQKSFVQWALAQGLSVFMVSWKSADESMKDIVWDDYIAAQIEAIDVIRARLSVEAVHTIGYCVAGTTLAATLAVLSAKGEADKVKSVTFLTAQVDFEQAGDLKIFIDDAQLAMLEQLSAPGFLDGRYMAATFNMLRGRDLIWNYVVNHYLLGKDYKPFDLLYWNGDTTNLPAKWHRQYLTDLYRDNRLVVPGALSALGTAIDLRKITTPAYVQAGREDHIAPAPSVWRITHHLSGELTFVLAGSGHIAGVVNPPSAKKYQYWTGEDRAASYEDFVATAKETKGSWWPHWISWIRDLDSTETKAKGARIPGRSGNKAIENAPGRYVKMR